MLKPVTIVNMINAATDQRQPKKVERGGKDVSMTHMNTYYSNIPDYRISVLYVPSKRTLNFDIKGKLLRIKGRLFAATSPYLFHRWPDADPLQPIIRVFYGYKAWSRFFPASALYCECEAVALKEIDLEEELVKLALVYS